MKPSLTLLIMEAVVKRELSVSKTLTKVIGVGVFITLTALGAFVRIPLAFTPVPITLQTLFVLLAGAFLGTRLGSISQLSYILLGISGVPIFSNAGFGLVYVLGPTGGYLLGFIIASLFVGRFIKYAASNLFYIFIIFCIADFMLLVSGTLWLKWVLRCSLSKSFFIGFIPFVYPDIIKVFAATIIYLKIPPRVKEAF